MIEFNKILKIEAEYDLINKMIFEDKWYYPLIKQTILANYINKQKLFRPHKSISNLQKIKNTIISSPYYLNNNKKRSNIIIVDNASTRIKYQNYSYLKYSDFIHDLFPNIKITVLEYPDKRETLHKKNNYSNSIYYLDFFINKVLLQSKIKNYAKNFSFNADKELFSQLDLPFHIASHRQVINKALHYINGFMKLLQSFSPDIIFIKPSYNYVNMSLLWAANKLGIPTVELQHGVIDTKHIGYIYNKVIDRQFFPKYFFSYGDYFSDILKNHTKKFLSENVFSIGYNYLEKYKKNQYKNIDYYHHIKNQYKIILITSQWIIKKELKNFVIKLSEILPKNWFILYKPHPAETNIESFYEIFNDFENVLLIKDKSISLFEFIKICNVHSTVMSTSHFEATYFEKPNVFIWQPKHSQWIEKFINNKTHFLAKNSDQYINCLNYINSNPLKIKNDLKSNSDYYFKSNSSQNFVSKTNWILNYK